MKTLREKFFAQCTDYNETAECPKVNMAPHDLFEWFKEQYSEALRIKPLVWGFSGNTWNLKTIFGTYVIKESCSCLYVAKPNDRFRSIKEELKNVKSACEAHYQARTMEGLQPCNTDE